MDILVFGAGAVGGYLGARLCNIGHNVTLISRRPAAGVIQRNGLILIEGENQIITNPAIVFSLRQAMEEDNGYDLVLLCMKAYDAKEALNEMAAFFPSPPVIITMQNGIGIEEMFIQEFGAAKIIAGSLTTPLSHETSHSIVVERKDRGLGLAPTGAGQDIKPFVEQFREAGVDTEIYADYQSMKWSKVLLNMVGNATSAILNRHPRVIYGYGPTFKLEIDMLKETLAVMKSKQLKVINLPGAQASRLASSVRRLPRRMVKPFLSRLVASGRGNKMPSFHIDLMAGKEQNEVSFHNGAVAEAGHELNIPTPVNEALNDILLKISRKEIDYQIFNGQPKKLVAEIQKYKGK